MRVLISGAGIAGLTTAFWLNQSGHNVTIVEKSSSLNDEGYMIDFFGPGYEVSKQMGLLDELAGIHYPISRLAFLDCDGTEKFSLPYATFRRIFNNRHFNFMRGDLVNVLHATIAGSVPIHLNTTIRWLHFEDDKVRAELSNGGEHRFDLVVGADGVHSAVRALLFGEERMFTRLLGYHTAAFIVDRFSQSLDLDQAFYLMTVPGKQVGVYPIRGNKIATFFIHTAESSINDFTFEMVREELGRVYRNLGWIVPELLKQSEHADIYFDEVSQIEVSGWSKGRVVLVGDACQSVSLTAGQGASLAMSGAYLLSHELAETPENIPLALCRYEQKLRPEIVKKQKAGRRAAQWFIPETWLRLAIRDGMTRLAVFPVGQHFFKRFFLTESAIVALN